MTTRGRRLRHDRGPSRPAPRDHPDNVPCAPQEDGAVQVDSRAASGFPVSVFRRPRELPSRPGIARHERQGGLDVREGGHPIARRSGGCRRTQVGFGRLGGVSSRRELASASAADDRSGPQASSGAQVRWNRGARPRPGATIDAWPRSESLGRRAEVGRQRGPAVRQDGQVLRAAEPGKLVDPAQREQGPDPEPFAAGARLATVGARRRPHSARFQATECQPGQGAAREDLIGSLGRQPQQGREIRFELRLPGRASARASARPKTLWSSRARSSASKAEYSAPGPVDEAGLDVEPRAVEPAGADEGVARPRRGDDRFVGRPGPRVVAEALFHEAEVEPGLEEASSLGRGQGTIHVVQR